MVRGILIVLAVCLVIVSPFVTTAYPQPQKIEIRPTAKTKEGKTGYTLYVKARPFFIKGVIYNPTPIGQGYDYDFFADPKKPWLIDGKLMKKAGINCMRIYSVGSDLTKTREFIQDMYKKFGIYTIVSDWLGLWTYPGPNYTDSDFRQKTKESILKIVETLKNEPGVLMWLLGNENNRTFGGVIAFWTSAEIEQIEQPRDRITKRAEIYYSFIDELAQEIKKIDPAHPVALGNGEANFLDIASKVCRNVDVLGIISYRGKTFGNLFNNVRSFFDKPILISEFGCDSYDAYRDKEDQDIQAEFILSQWQDIYKHTTLAGNKSGNTIGGTLFEWNDEWWKHNEGFQDDWLVHNKEGGWSQGSYYFDIRAKNNLNMQEEWFGIISLGTEKEYNINKRIPKKSFFILQRFFAHPTITSPKKSPSKK